jgi:hypothetical protein
VKCRFLLSSRLVQSHAPPTKVISPANCENRRFTLSDDSRPPRSFPKNFLVAPRGEVEHTTPASCRLVGRLRHNAARLMGGTRRAGETNAGEEGACAAGALSLVAMPGSRRPLRPQLGQFFFNINQVLGRPGPARDFRQACRPRARAGGKLNNQILLGPPSAAISSRRVAT